MTVFVLPRTEKLGSCAQKQPKWTVFCSAVQIFWTLGTKTAPIAVFFSTAEKFWNLPTKATQISKFG
jgi:hypothetical protein